MRQKVFFTLAIVGIFLFFFGKEIDSEALRMIGKPLPLLMLLLLLKPNTRYRQFIFAGLLLSLVGDVLLEASSHWFLYGLITFLLAHVAYLVAFTGRTHKTSWPPLIFLLVYGAAFYWVLFSHLQAMAVPVLVYLLTILAMTWRAMAQTNSGRWAIFATVGALFFVVSDATLAFNKFYTAIPASDWIIMLSYWAAQFLIFYSAFREGKKGKSEDRRQKSGV